MATQASERKRYADRQPGRHLFALTDEMAPKLRELLKRFDNNHPERISAYHNEIEIHGKRLTGVDDFEVQLWAVIEEMAHREKLVAIERALGVGV